MGGWCQWSYPHFKMIYCSLFFLLMGLSKQCNDAIIMRFESGCGGGGRKFKMNEQAVTNGGGEFSR